MPLPSGRITNSDQGLSAAAMDEPRPQINRKTTHAIAGRQGKAKRTNDALLVVIPNLPLIWPDLPCVARESLKVAVGRPCLKRILALSWRGAWRVSELASGLTRNQVPRKGLWVRIPCPPLE